MYQESNNTELEKDIGFKKTAENLDPTNSVIISNSQQKMFHKTVKQTGTDYCPVCKMNNTMYINLQDHMKARRDMQFENCQLFFRKCNTLSCQMDGRCKTNKLSKR